MKFYLKNIIGSLIMMTVSSIAIADGVPELIDKAKVSASVLREITEISEQGMPRSLLNKAVCIATIPNVLKAGFIFGGQYGQGMVSCRVGGGWSHPSFLTVAGGTWGFQIGAESVDLVLIFTKSNAAERFSKDNFTLSGDASVAAGPIGRDAQAGTDVSLTSEIYSYSRSRGLFAGLTLGGTVIAVDKKANALAYGHEVNAIELLENSTHSMLTPSIVRPYTEALAIYAH